MLKGNVKNKKLRTFLMKNAKYFLNNYCVCGICLKQVCMCVVNTCFLNNCFKLINFNAILIILVMTFNSILNTVKILFLTPIKTEGEK